MSRRPLCWQLGHLGMKPRFWSRGSSVPKSDPMSRIETAFWTASRNGQRSSAAVSCGKPAIALPALRERCALTGPTSAPSSSVSVPASLAVASTSHGSASFGTRNGISAFFLSLSQRCFAPETIPTPASNGFLSTAGRDSSPTRLADPFGVVRDDRIQILCESFGYRSGKGHICALAYSNRRFTTQPEPAIELPVHLSYPFLVEEAGQIYCIPEACGAGEVALFRAVDFPRKWSKVAVLVEHFGGVDPTVFRHDGRWWLMCTEKGRDADVKLWIWHASDLLGPWAAHARNPVKTDVRTARPGGVPFVHEGVLYRPAQDCSKRYGWRIVIQRVTTLTPSEFAEEPVAVLEASADSPFPLGRHTLTAVGEVILIDGHRTVFVWHALRSFVRILAQPFWSKLRPRRSDAASC